MSVAGPEFRRHTVNMQSTQRFDICFVQRGVDQWFIIDCERILPEGFSIYSTSGKFSKTPLLHCGSNELKSRFWPHKGLPAPGKRSFDARANKVHGGQSRT
jgi:hypothetical protein